GLFNPAAFRAAFAQPTSTIIVKNCGVPVNNAMVSMQVKTSAGLNFTLPGFRTGSGVYQVPIPTPNRDDLLRAKQKCLRVAHFLDAACAGIQALFISPLSHFVCPAIAAAVALIPGGELAIPAILEVCEPIVEGIELYCGLGGPTLSEILCDRINLAIDRASFGPVTLIPTAKIPGED